jgi:hypothetical protein
MTATADVLAAVLFIFFVVGVGVGILIVIAMSARRADKASRGRHHQVTPAARPGDEPPWWQSRDDDARR